MKATLQTRQAQLFMQSFNLWLTQGYADKLVELSLQERSDFDDWWEKYSPKKKNLVTASVFYTIDTYFEGRYLSQEELIDPHLVDDLSGSDIIHYCKRMCLIAEGMRKRYGWSSWAENSEYLYDEMLNLYKQQHPETKI
jgi:hypothetical protein